MYKIPKVPRNGFIIPEIQFNYSAEHFNLPQAITLGASPACLEPTFPNIAIIFIDIMTGNIVVMTRVLDFVWMSYTA